MSLREEIKPYIDESGFVRPYKRGESGPGAGNSLYTWEYFLQLALRDDFNEDDEDQFRQIYYGCEKASGLMARSFTNPDQQAPDDYIGLMAAAYHCDLFDISRDILAYGKKNNWVYNNVKPGDFSLPAWFGRMPQVVAHFYFANLKNPPLYYKIGFNANLFNAAGAKAEDNDAWILSWLLVKTAKEQSSLCTPFIKLWEYAFQKKLGSDLRISIMKSLNNNPDHPLVRYWIS